MSNLPTVWRAALGLDNDQTQSVYKFGFNPGVDSTEATVWEQGGAYAYIVAATVLKISSSSTADTSAGTGARTITVEGLDADYNQLSETVILTGQTAVNTVGLFLRVFRMIVETAGSGGANAGVLYAGTGTVTTGVPANIFATIAIGSNQTLMALYTIPKGFKALLVGVHISSSANQVVTFRVIARPEGGVFNVKEKALVFRSMINLDHDTPTVLDEKTDVEIRASAPGTSDVSGALELVLFRK